MTSYLRDAMYWTKTDLHFQNIFSLTAFPSLPTSAAISDSSPYFFRKSKAHRMCFGCAWERLPSWKKGTCIMFHAQTTTAGLTPKKERNQIWKVAALLPSGSCDMILLLSCSTCTSITGMNSKGLDHFAMVKKLLLSRAIRQKDLHYPKFGSRFELHSFCTGFYGKPTLFQLGTKMESVTWCHRK